MPIQYSSILAEARAVRSNAGLFDVSHMGRVDIQGLGAAEFLNRVLSVDVPGLRMGRAKYNVICNEGGGIIDDCIVYRRSEDRFLLIPNAANTPPVLEWLEKWSPGEPQVRMENVTAQYAMIACQGPKAVEMLNSIASDDISATGPFAAVESKIAGVDTFLGRTGYTGEDGFELIVPSENAVDIWTKLMEIGAVSCGLGARDVLRLEAGLLLHGNDMDTSVNPYEAGLDRFVEPDRKGYIARDALLRARDEGVDRTLVAFNMVGRGIARHGMSIMNGADKIGEVTSGGHSPTLDRSIGLGYVPTGNFGEGTRFQIDVRGRLVEAEVTKLPFYSRRRKA
jgi:aminomethyltransferase